MNVLVIVADQHLAGCTGYEGHPQVITPHLDRLAAEGTAFRHAYAANPICTPSRVSMLSGQFCHNHGYYGLSGPAPAALPSYLSHFRERGYRTAAIGVVHTPNDPRNWLDGHVDAFLDYEESIDGVAEQTPFYDGIRRQGLYDREDVALFRTRPELALEGFPSALPFEASQEGWCVEAALQFIRDRGDRPFCVQVGLQRPHQPFTPDRRFWDLYPDDLALPPTIDRPPDGRPPHFRAAYRGFRQMGWALEPRTFEAAARRIWHGYLGCITHVDHAVGLLLRHLEDAGLAGDTVVVYTADHGGYSGTHGICEKAPGICSEAVCRVPMVWRVPGTRERGSVCRHLVQGVDIGPTLAALCGLPPMPTADGRDASALIAGAGEPIRDVAVTEHPWSKALRWDRWRFVHYQREMFGGDDVGELYDIESDPDETVNLYGDPQHRATVEECRRRLLEWIIGSTRVKTVWPAVDWSRSPYVYPTGADGCETTEGGPALRARQGRLEYL